MERIKVDVWGSCVSRDSLSIGGEDLGVEVTNYFESCAPHLQFTQHILPDVHIEDYTHIQHNAQKKWACHDLNKTIPSTLDSSESEWLILDSRSFGYGAVRINIGGDSYEYATNVGSLDARLKPISPYIQNCQKCGFTDDLKNALQDFLKWCHNRYRNKIILIETTESPLHITAEGDIQPNPSNLNSLEMSENEKFFEKEVISATNCHFIQAPPIILSDDLHRWGFDRVHYITEYYTYVYAQIMSILNGQNNLSNSECNKIYCNTTYRISRILNTKAKSENNSLQRAWLNAKANRPEVAFSILDDLQNRDVNLAYLYRARIYRDGVGVRPDYLESKKWMELALNYNVKPAGAELFDLLWKIATPDAYDEAFAIAKQMANSGDAESMGRLGRAYRDGKGVEKDLQQAAEWMRKAANNKLNWAKLELFDILWAIGKPESFTEMISTIDPMVQNGNENAMLRLGRAYRYGKGVEKNLHIAADWLRNASSGKTKWIKNELFDVLWEIGTPESYKEAFRSVSEIANTNVGAMLRIGRAYRDGKGVEKDLQKAAEWMRKAANENNDWIKLELFDTLWKIGTPDTYQEGFDTIIGLANENNGGAMGRVGRAYRDGKGVEKNIEKALCWMKKASEQNPKWEEEYLLLCRTDRKSPIN